MDIPKNENNIENSELVLYGNPICPYSQRIVLALEALNLSYEYHEVDFILKPSWLGKISPLNKVPVLKTEHGYLFESTAILEYLNDISKEKLTPQEPYERARMYSWREMIEHLHELTLKYFSEDNESQLIEKGEKLSESLMHFLVLENYDLIQRNIRPSMIDICLIPLLVILDVLNDNGPINFFENSSLRILKTDLLNSDESLAQYVNTQENRADLLEFIQSANHQF